MTREEAIKLIDTHTVCFYNEIDSPTLQALHLAIEALSEVRCNDCKWNDDVVEVVRCKDCRHYESDGGALMVCSITDTVKDDADFCSYGERREKVNGFKSAGQAWNTSQGRWEP